MPNLANFTYNQRALQYSNLHLKIDLVETSNNSFSSTATLPGYSFPQIFFNFQKVKVKFFLRVKWRLAFRF